jgi:hypothetical protein
LFVDRGQDGTGLVIESVHRLGVADLLDPLAPWNIPIEAKTPAILALDANSLQ